MSWFIKRKKIVIFLASFLIAGGVFIATGRVADTSSEEVQVEYSSPVITHAYALKKKAILYNNVKLTQAINGSSFLKTAWYRTHAAKLSINGKTQTAYQVKDNSGKYTFWVLRSQLKSINSNSYKLKLAGANNRFYHKKIGFFGDSIPSGWDGYHFYMNNSYPDWMNKYLGTDNRVENFSVPHAKIVGKRFAYIGTTRVAQDLPVAIKYHENDIRNMNMIFIHIGTNDYTNYSGSGSLRNVIAHLKRNVMAIKLLNPTAKLYGVLPLTRYDANGQNRQNMSDMYGYTFGQLRSAEAKLYRQLGVNVINFDTIAPNLITDQNKDIVYEDHEIHPTPQVAQKLGYYLAKYLISK
ncbi:MAG: SGNH/GDSL hydrolase family protein [Lentilactobacillus hilgardii]|uniref:SGNH/GDSL hydrolase family protein n=1 Tax=Lentilactobacillus hilgardii TaxID=1588 RepID=A0A6P1EFM5_LENHI|nr:SGNH/GDSL hydrolase family protein [Lentilactobacillus hilgardii]RRG12677.1 MAG: SGNH/GDSL hydrolase family protein [Lactobacillus sp.]EEI70791.1 GDSL-like protein [Lentilactobacillus hilgardii ATCC 27305]MBZ2200424.1 SGNH/GDSL hydrolase family protein [Lentilactobacillus hilgardii]MBZ2204270.1 SGNH/GDSL hydrolase family protein [Lentilactobacillus hilgardii]MCT3390520.1 SGNH/GDSL hydrolase family protein [Lentilactobacillus hilgardii]